ncbi:unnamed protein product [Cercopithifilaria johnstoni]|uniref:Uncharacterized protein n=1 Tax=Cercopithifilaria johnstoni TaxID=2874296 RepID=A0A8J2Q9C5_9BILA|nr:unnamed protein product [Cercopithifilaria johnstoni]
MAEQQQQQQEQQERGNNQSRLPSDWFYSSVMLTNHLDIGEHAGIGSFQMDHLEQNDQSILACNNLSIPEFSRICQNTDVANDLYPDIVTTTSSSTSPSTLCKSSFQISCLETSISHDKIIQNQDIQIKDSSSESNIGTDTNFTYTIVSNPNSLMTNRSSMNNCNRKLQSQYRSKRNQRGNVDKPRITLICNNNVGSSSSRKNDNIQLERVEKVEVEDSDGDGGRAPPNVLYSHSTANSSDKMKWDCGVRWPSAKRTGMLTSSYSVNIDAHDNSGAPDDGMTTAMDIDGNAGMIESSIIDIGSEFGRNTGEVIQEMKVTTNTILDNEGSKGIAVPKATIQLQNESNLTDATTVTAKGTTSPSVLPSSKVGLDEQSSSPIALFENLSLPSKKVPIKKRLIHSSLTTASYNKSAKATNTCTNISPNTYDTLSEHHQPLPTTIASGAIVASTATESAFSSCYQITATGSTGTMINEDPMPPVTTYSKLLTSNDAYGSVLNDHAIRIASNSDPLPIAAANSLSEAEIVNLLCRNLCDIERIIAQQRIAYSGTSAIQLPSLLSQCNDEHKSQVSYTGSGIVPHHEQQQQQQYHHHHHHHHHQNVAMERRRSGTIDSNDTRRFHPYVTIPAAATTTTTTTTTTTKAIPTTACCSNNITVWSPSAPSRADLKQKYLRSLAPVLYDLLTDDCESKNCQKTTDSMDCSILKSCVEPSMDSYFRSLSLLAATASLPFTNNKFDHLPFNYIDYFALQQCSLLFGSTPVTSTDLLKLAQSANLLHSAALTIPTTNPETILSDKIPFTNKIDQVN